MRHIRCLRRLGGRLPPSIPLTTGSVDDCRPNSDFPLLQEYRRRATLGFVLSELGGEDRGRRVLVVEDHADSKEALILTLERAGYAVRGVDDGATALEAIEADAPDLIVLDLMLPVVTGWELLRILRSETRTAKIPVIVVSAYYTPHRELGPVRFIAKPARMEALLRAIQEATQARGAA